MLTKKCRNTCQAILLRAYEDAHEAKLNILLLVTECFYSRILIQICQTKCTKQPALPLSEFNGSEHIWSIKYCGQFEMYIYLFFFLFVFIYLFFHKNWAECSIAQRGGNYPAGAEHTQMPFKKTLDSKPCETVVPLSIFSLACSLKKTYCKCLSYIIYIFFFT